MPLSPATVNGPYFAVAGRAFMPIGAHWVPAKAGLQWPTEFDEAEVEADFAKMRELGFNTMRFDLFWAWFEPRPGDYNPEAFRQFDVFIRLAHAYDLYLHPTFFIGGEVGEAFWDVPWRQGRHPHADAEMLRLQTDHAAEFARRYKGEPAILAWDLTDEPPFWIVGDQTTDAMAINWTRLIAGALRRHDPGHVLCVGTNVEDIAHGPFRPDTIIDEVDFLSVHPYSIYTLDRFPDPMLSERGTYAAAFQTTLSGGAGKPVMIHEFGASSAQYSPERVAAFDRVTMYSGLAAGSCGFLPWCYTDAAPAQYTRTPYRRAPHETQFGLTTWDRRDRPRGTELRRFNQVLGQMDLTGVAPALGEAALIVPLEWAKPHGDFSRLGLSGASAIPYTSTQDRFDMSDANLWYTRATLSAFILGRRAGLKVDMPRETMDWRSRRLLLLPAPLTSTERNLVHVHTPFWDEVRAYVNAGGAVYASVCADAAIPEMADLFGCELADHIHADDVALTFVAPFGDIAAGTTWRYRADPGDPRQWPATLTINGGEVLAVDQDGRPALVLKRYGKGQALLCAYPLETYLGVTPSAFEAEEPTHRLYRAFADSAGIVPRFCTNNPSVEAAGLIGEGRGGGRGYVVLANHRGRACTVTLTARDPIRNVAQITPLGSDMLPGGDQTWTFALDAHGGAVLSWTA